MQNKRQSNPNLQDTDYRNETPIKKKLNKNIINTYSPELLQIINSNKSVFKNYQQESIDFIPFVQERDGCGRIISSSTRSSSLINQNSSKGTQRLIKKIPTFKPNKCMTPGGLGELVPFTTSRPQTTQSQQNKPIQYAELKKSTRELNFEKFKANMPFHATLNNDEDKLIKITKITQLLNKQKQNPTTACFKNKPRNPIYSSNIEYPAIGQYDISTKSTQPKITRNIFIPSSSFKQLPICTPDSLDYVNLMEVFKKQHEIDKISSDFSKQTHRDLFATLLNQKKEKFENEDEKILMMEPEEMKRAFQHQSQVEDLIYSKFKKIYSPYVMKIKKQQQPIVGIQFRDTTKKIYNHYKIIQRIRKKPAKLEY